MIKQCVVCGVDFDARGRAKTCCSDCSRENNRSKKREYDKVYRAENESKIKADKQRQYHYQRNVDIDAHRSKMRERAVEYYWRDPEKYRARSRDYHKRNRRKCLEKNKRYNRERTAALRLIRELEAKGAVILETKL